MEFITQYGPLIIASLVLLALIAYVIYVAVTEPKKIKKWLFWACSQAEIHLGSKTGQLKLRDVYDMFLTQFPVFSKLISFATFQKWTELALIELKDWLASNEAAKQKIMESEKNEESN